MNDSNPEPTRGAGAILATILGILILVAAFLNVGHVADRELTMGEVLGDLSPTSDTIPGMQVLAIERLTDGRMVCLLGDPNDVPAEKEMGDGSMGMGMGGGRGGGMRGMGGMGGMGFGKPDPNSPWPKLPEGEPGAAPWQAAFVHWPSSKAAEGILASEFGRLNFKDLSTLPPSGGSAVIDSGFTEWKGYRLPYVRTRHFRKEDKVPVFHESMRINLTRGRHSLVLYLRWRPGQKASIETAQPLLDHWVPAAIEGSIQP
ncbi:MAG: hypothetical protein KDB61_01345 [Planctomycetes bacterium]|nr:hypothetical protein [Planctomycetota bacterium]